MFLSRAKHLVHSCASTLRRSFSSAPPLVVQVWGADTGVGKTVISCGLLRSRNSTSLYLKPVQTGFPQDDDASQVEKHASNIEAVTINTYEQPTSPDLAATLSNFCVSDETLRNETGYVIQDFFQRNSDSGNQNMTLVETAGGVLSPCPSGTTQADVFRPFRFPALLVGDSKLGGISGTLAAYEALTIRGYSVPCVVMLANDLESLRNETSVRNIVGPETEVLLAPSLPPPHVPLHSYLQSQAASAFFQDLNSFLERHQQDRFKALLNMKSEARQVFWYPFTQHSQLSDITCIDSAHGDHFTCAKEDGYYTLVDTVGSWWTNGVGHGNGKTALALAAAAGRYGHVMFAEAVHEPAFKLSKRLLNGVGAGWASRVFFSDNGSTAVEVALKMAFRQRIQSTPERGNLPVKIVGLRGSYHGDTLGVMDCSEQSDYNKAQTPWYQPRGIFLDPPTVSIKNGVWSASIPDWIDVPQEIILDSRNDVFSPHREVKAYNAAVRRVLDSVLENDETDLGALLIEPLLQGAGGMKLVDPAFQRALISECRKSLIPVVFDEIFTGLWRLGCESGASLLNAKPDIAAFGKLLTGGTVPLAVTLAKESVFEAFSGSSKREALLHGHSYTAHAVGSAVAVESLDQYECLKEAVDASSHEYWPEAYARELSTFENVDGVTSIGTVLAVELRSLERGYASIAAKGIVDELKNAGVFARPLGNVVYILCTPLSGKKHCNEVLTLLMKVIETGGQGSAPVINRRKDASQRSQVND